MKELVNLVPFDKLEGVIILIKEVRVSPFPYVERHYEDENGKRAVVLVNLKIEMLEEGKSR